MQTEHVAAGVATRAGTAPRGRGPAVLVIPLTYKCNVRCVMCSVWEREDPQSVSHQAFQRVLDDADLRESLEVVSFTGGEPFLRSDIPEMAGLLAAACPHLREIGIPTNGSMPPRIAQEVGRLLEALPDTVTLVVAVSVDGGADVHDRLRGVPGLHRRTVSTLRLLSDIRRTGGRLALGINMTVMPANVGDVPEVLALGESLGIGVTLTPAVRSDLHIDSLSSQGWDRTPAEGDRVTQALRREAARTGSTNLIDACDVMDGAPRSAPCVFWTRGAFLDADGGLYVCPVTRDGFIATVTNAGDMSAVWGGAAHIEALERLRTGACRSCLSNCMASEADRGHLLEQVGQAGKPVVIFGAGGGGRKARAQLGLTGIVVRRFVDNSPSLQGQTIDGVPIVPFDGGDACRGALTVVATITGAGQVAAQLEAAGFVEGQDFVRYF